jgi:hypothetical protein
VGSNPTLSASDPWWRGLDQRSIGSDRRALMLTPPLVRDDRGPDAAPGLQVLVGLGDAQDQIRVRCRHPRMIAELPASI